MSEGPPTPKKGNADPEDLDGLSKADLIARVKEQELYIKQLENKRMRMDRDDDLDSNERLKQHQKDATRRENTLVHRLTTKEQELQDFINQITELKQAQTQGATQLRSMLLDPAVNITFQRLTKEMDDAQEKLKQTQNELSAWKFTPDSQTGKRLMARCQMLLQENEELGKTIASGRTAKLEGEIALQKTLVTEMKNNQSELDEFLGDLEEDVEGMQTMIYVLQQQLKESKEQITALEQENARLQGKDMSGSFQTLVPKKRDKISKPIKTEETNNKDFSNNASVEHPENNYAAMETGYYQNERTDSDLEAEYNYEGLYENDDRYQEELEAQQAVESNQYDYQDNIYSTHIDQEEEYNSKDNSDLHFGNNAKQDHEAMETEDVYQNEAELSTKADSQAHQKLTKISHNEETDTTHRSDIVQVTYTRVEQVGESSGQLIDSTSGEADSLQKKQVYSVIDSLHESTKDLSEECQHLQDTGRTETNCKEITTTKDRTPEKEINSSLYGENDSNKVDSKQESSSHDSKSNQDSLTVSLGKEKGSSKGKSGENQLSPNDTHTEADSSASSCSAAAASSNSAGKDRSPVSSSVAFKEREPVLQKFLNGVTSTVDDIVDL